MENTKLIIVEGIPGSGKTSTAQYIKDLLDKQGIKNELYNEGDLNHPADYEYTACFNKIEFGQLSNKFVDYVDILEEKTEVVGDNFFINYAKLKQEKGESLPEEFYKELNKFDVCEGLSLERYHELTLLKWRSFAEKASREDKVYIFECCFIQNPAVVMLALHFADKQYIINHILDLEDIINKLNPKLIYFYQDSVRETIERVAEARDNGWINFVIKFIADSIYGARLNLSGFDGAVKFFEDRREVELEVFEKLSINKILLDNSEYNWNNRYKEIEEFLQPMLKK
jgi:hypothetical protein